MLKVIILACFIALVAAQCSNYGSSYECQLASTSTQCCIWAHVSPQPTAAPNSPAVADGACVNGFVSSVSTASSGTNNNVPGASNGGTYPCGNPALAYTSWEGSCQNTANCPNQAPNVTGVWYYPPECAQIGGQFQISSQTNGQFAITATNNQALRLPSFTGALDNSGQVVLTNPNDGTQCYGYAAAQEMYLTCPSLWGGCQQHFYRSSAATTAASIVAILAAVALFALF